VIIRRLALTSFRNYSSLDLELPTRASVFLGDNAQGKTNLLEAIYLLATSKSSRASAEGELINWQALHAELPACRVVADVRRDTRSVTIEIAIGSRNSAIGRPTTASATAGRMPGTPTTLKRIKVNGVPRRAADLVGQVNVVAFSVHDIDIVGGEPSLRRRYLDTAICQVNREYLRQLQRYNRIIHHRNRLLRQIAENQAGPDDLTVWDEEMVVAGTYLTQQREHLVMALQRRAQDIHREISGNQSTLRLAYIRSIDRGMGREDPASEDVAGTFSRALASVRSREIAQGVSVAGPHRDDLRIYEDDVDMGIFGSRGQQRTIALSLKLAESAFMLEETGDCPVLLLDDVLSELDGTRRQHLLQYVSGYEQVLVAATDPDDFEARFLDAATLFRVSEGSISHLVR
jgi:DNA replication and repair protein RecF